MMIGLMEFVPEIDMNAIDGAIADLAARTDRPQGYPFSKVMVYSVCPEVAAFMPYLNYVSAANVPSMRKLDFKKAGKVFGSKVQEMKNDLSKAPDEYIITASRFDAIDEPTRKTTGCRKHMIEVECQDQEDKWLATQFRKAIKKYVTEDMAINIVPPIFGDKYPELNESCVARVVVTLGNCSERLYQALEEHGKAEFAEYPIRLYIPSRQYICEHMGEHVVKFGAETTRFDVNIPSRES
jgi:hypothetical protein